MRGAPIRPTPSGVARIVETEDVALSADGTAVAAVVRSVVAGSYRRDVWVAAVDGDAPPVRVSRGRGSATGPRWSPDGATLAWIREVPAGVRLELHDVATGSTTGLTAALPGIDGLAWSPDGHAIAFTGRVVADVQEPGRTHVVTGPGYKRDGEGLIRGRSGLHVVDIVTATLRTIRQGTADLETPRWSPDGRALAVTARAPGGYRSTIEVVGATATPGDPAVTAGTSRSRFRHGAWSPDSTRLLLVGSLELSFHPGLSMFDVGTGQLHELAADPRCEVVDDPAWVDPGCAILHGRERATSGLYAVDLDSGSIDLLGTTGRRLWGLSADATGSRFAQVEESVTQPGSPVVFDRSLAAWQPASPRRKPRRLPLFEPTRHSVASDGVDIDYWVLRPPHLPLDTPAPAIVIVHGGPHHDVGDDWDGGLRQVLAARGFVVAWANPRGSTSYGRDFADAVVGDFGGAEYRDLLAVVDAVAARPDVDGSRLGICGHSHGGYMTAWTIARSSRFAAAVALSPVFDLRSEWGMSDEGVTWGEVLHGGTPGERPDLYRDRSPSTWAWATRTPTLIAHGARDERCPVGQSELMFATLRSAGCDTELVLYPDAGHDLWSNPGTVEDLTGRVSAWFERWLGAGRTGG